MDYEEIGKLYVELREAECQRIHAKMELSIAEDQIKQLRTAIDNVMRGQPPSAGLRRHA